VTERRVQCPVLDEPELVVQEEVNAFRILPETGNAYFLDFICYSPALLRAVVVARLRVHEDVLRSIRERLSHDLIEAPDQGVSVIWADMTPVGMVN